MMTPSGKRLYSQSGLAITIGGDLVRALIADFEGDWLWMS